MTSTDITEIGWIPVSELKSRIERIRAAMRERGIEVLLVAGHQDIFNRGHIRYISNLGRGGNIVLPLEGNLTYFLHPALVNSPKLHKGGSISEFIDVLPFGDGAYGLVNDSVGKIRSMNVQGKVGYVGGASIGIAVHDQLIDAFGRERLVDASDIFWKLRTIKSENELALMRRSAELADDCLDVIRPLIRPGVSDYEIYAEAKRFLFSNKSPYSLEVIDAHGPYMNFEQYPHGDVLERGGTLMMEITPAFGGYYAQLPFTVPVDELSPSMRRLAEAWKAGFELGESMLRPGTRISELSRALRQRIAEAGGLNPFSHGHAIGLDVYDGWGLADSVDFELEPGMTFAMHPASIAEVGGESFSCGYTYVVTEDGAERMSRHDFYQGW